MKRLPLPKPHHLVLVVGVLVSLGTLASGTNGSSTAVQDGDPVIQASGTGSGAKGNVYIQALITYTALADGATYNPFDWQVFCNDEAVDSYTYVSDGPEPDLNSGTLPKGRKAKGWVVYEIPAKGRCVLSYGANSFIDEGAVFEVLIRKG